MSWSREAMVCCDLSGPLSAMLRIDTACRLHEATTAGLQCHLSGMERQGVYVAQVHCGHSIAQRRRAVIYHSRTII